MESEYISYDEIWALYEKSDRISEAEFDALYDVVVAYLKTKGSFSGGLEDADFSGSCWMAPTSTLTLVSNVPITLPFAEGLRDELQKLSRPHAVVFDGMDGTSCVTSGGRFIREK